MHNDGEKKREKGEYIERENRNNANERRSDHLLPSSFISIYVHIFSSRTFIEIAGAIAADAST